MHSIPFYKSSDDPCCIRVGRMVVSIFALLIILFPILFFTAVAFADVTPHSPLVIRVGAYENRPKIYTDESGQVVGMFPDVLAAIAKKERWSIQYVPGTWSQCLERLEKNTIDMMVDVAYSEKRAKTYLFSNETFFVNWAAVYTGNNTRIDSLVELNGKKVAVMKDSIHTEGDGGIKKLVAAFDIRCTFVEVGSYRDVFKLLSENQVDAGVVNRIFGSLFAEEYDARKTSIIFNPRHLRFAFPKNSAVAPLLLERIDSYLDKWKRNRGSIYYRVFYAYLSGMPRETIFSEFPTGQTVKSIGLTADEKAWIRNHPVIRLGVDPEFAPFEYITGKGRYSGIASEYVNILNRRLGLNMKLAGEFTWKEAVQKAKAKEIDVLPCVGITQERKRFFLFSRPYIKFHRVIITKADHPFLRGVADIEPLTVAVQQDSSNEGYLRDNTSIEPILYKTLQEALLAVSNGKAQAFVGNIASSTYWIRKLNLTNLKVAAPVSYEAQDLHFAVRSDWPELVRIINKGLAAMSQKEEDDIRRRWVNVEYEPGISPRIVWRYILQVVGIAFVILIVVLAWNYRLKKEIRKRIEIENKLSEANEGLKKIDQLKSMFIASMSHELRTPLNSIIGFTGIIVQGMTGPLNEKQKDHLTRVYHSAKHLLTLITDVIDISKIEAGRVDVYPEDFVLSDVIDEALINVEPQLKKKNLQLAVSIPEDLHLHTDRKRLQQCLINYLSNAVKYSESGGIVVEATTRNGQVKITVTDTGIGISQQDQSRLFEAFERMDSHLRVKAGGTGLGLYLTRKLATEILGGDIFVKSQPGKGSTFGIVIPIRIEKPDHGQEPTGEDNQ